ncbi:MAG: thiamine-phosphate pyrophosphorylase [Candidatus Omnitrophica bacterium]|nr:thiamine-phosphate pyrophosphorylase [Candidatus Omnitrophota bacterium]MBU1924146.1 thiamine-phosphate pyrophosphorylase [Candidatus Omnitrophota bacterium]
MKKLSRVSRKNKLLNIHRIIDANLNRAKEGLRVCEEITRFILDNHKLTLSFKKTRHGIDGIIKKTYPASVLFKERNSNGDVGRLNSRDELKRDSCKDIFWANIQRVKESLRVLEEFSKLVDAEAALCFKQLRYKVYEIEKDSFKKISSLPDSRSAGCY